MSLGTKLKKLFGLQPVNEATWDQCTDLLIEADIIPSYAFELVDKLRTHFRNNITDFETLKSKLGEFIAKDIVATTMKVSQTELTAIMLLGVNGVGKTSTAAKIASWAEAQIGAERIILAAADTFRAAAIDQLKIHAQKLQYRIVAQEHGSDPGAVIYDALEAAIAGKAKLVIADTAGRLHNKQNLVKELEKINKIIKAKKEVLHYRKLLVLDATTGSNALRQAELFSEAIQLDGFVLTKFDSSAKGGMLASICRTLKLPAYFICFGESYTDIQPVDISTYISKLLA